MTAAVLELAELAARVGGPVDTVRRDAETGLRPPAPRDGDRYGYPPAAAHKVAGAGFSRLSYTGVRACPGGKADWTDAGLPLEGARALPKAAV